MATTSSSSLDAARPRRHEVEIYAHALRTRLQFASFKALNGVGKTSLSDLTSSTLTPVQPLAPSLASNNQIVDQPHTSSSPASTPALSQGESLPSSSQSSTRSTRSIYLDIFGTDFRASSTTTTPSSSKGLSRATSFASTSTPTKRASSSSNTTSTSTSTRSLLDKAASSPQLGSPERKNGRFDWHNNPTPAMVAHETKLATGQPFALPTGSPSKRRREESNNASPTNPLLNTPRRSRMQSSGFLPNGHPASSLAQDLGLTAPRTPRSRHASGRHVFAIQPQPLGGEQDQVERDRVASTLAALAEARNAASSGSDSSSGSDRPHTPPPPSAKQQQGLGIGFASPSIRRNSTFAQPHGHKRHKRNVSWNVLPVDLQDEQESISRAQDDTPAAQGEEDRAAADYLLFLASSPSPSSIKRFSGDGDAGEAGGMLSTPAQVSLWDPFQSSNGSGDGRRSRMQSHAGGPRHTNLSFAGPLTPPPSARKLSKPHDEAMVGLGFDVQTLSSTPSKPSANAHEYIQQRRSSTTVTPTSPRTPPPELSHKRRRSITREFGGGGETPGAPGGEQTFSYADFVNVSPSPQPPSTARFAGLDCARGLRTPTKVDRWTFDRQ
ncbi:hypothetical protein PHSY_003422 [Pseudozyma hubeiensis SY62]|uniref:Uncharacterized protein n=1 Tax=Pseudozyma hubeiensis (strain SY62) TaxID=1305764 RepID=R9PCR8_PSEHS|nr:hypothetical protein PHSY_003422 [Pseudozyma hubeiensis SY62]GAC95845.1 hypothetical protein PHSY_003422 [Pseudozyma hubeiensis SY62]